MMAHGVDGLLLLLVAAGWPEKAIKLLLSDIKELPQEQIERDYRALKRRLSTARKGKKPAQSKSVATETAAKAARLLKSGSSLSHPELAERLLEHLRFSHPNRAFPQMPPKSGLESWLAELAKILGSSEFLHEVTVFRNHLMHNPGESWRLRL